MGPAPQTHAFHRGLTSARYRVDMVSRNLRAGQRCPRSPTKVHWP
jgi:hypothetical protein